MTRKVRRLAVAFAALALLALPSLASATVVPDPDHVSFTLEGCRLPVGQSLPDGAGNFVCPDADYTTGNLGKNWNELDLVPFRLTAASGTNVDQTYNVAIALDACDGGPCPPTYTGGVLDAGSGNPGYDVIGSDDDAHGGRPVINSKSGAGCAVTDSGQLDKIPGVGGTGQTIYRILTITQPANTTCVFDWYGRLALGSHLYPGASLHANLLNQDFGTSGIGAKDVSIPVNEIEPQDLSVEADASQDQNYSWNVSKQITGDSTSFTDPCSGRPQSAALSIQVSWTRTAVSGSGIVVTAKVSAINPAHRDVTVTPTDAIKVGSTTLDTKVGSPVVVPGNGNGDPLLVLTHTFTVPSGSTNINGVASATYTDVATNIPVPGTTSKTWTISTIGTGAVNNDTATVSDIEKIVDGSHADGTGSILTSGADFAISSIDSSAGVTVTPQGGYTLGTYTDGPVTLNTNTVSDSGNFTVHKVVRLTDDTAPLDATLYDQATLTPAGSSAITSRASRSITLPACGTITIVKDALPNDAQDFAFTSSTEEPTTIDGFSLDDDGDATLSNSATFSNLTPGSYSVTEGTVKGWHLTGLSCDDDSSQSVDASTADIAVPAGGHVTCTFENTKVNTSIEIVKTGSPDVVHDGDNVTFSYAVSNPSSNNGSLSGVTVSDDKCSDVKGPLTKTGGNDDALLDPGETWTFSCTTPALHADEDASHVITNVATATGNDEYGDPHSAKDDDTTKVIHPAIAIDKTGPATAQAGDKIAYLLTVTNPGDTPLAESTLKVVDEQCNGDPVTLLSKSGDASPGSFDPGDVWTYTCSLQTAVGDQAVENHASAEGTDQLGKVVASADAAATVLSPPAQAVLGARVVPGTARLLGPTGCQSNAFNARIRGSKMATVTFVLDGKIVKKVKNTKNAKQVQFRIKPTKLRVGVHRLVVNITFQAGSGTKPKTLRLSFQRCAKKLVAPRFTG